MVHRYILRPVNGGSIRFNAIGDRSIKGGGKFAITTDFEIVDIVDDVLPKNLITINFDTSTRTTYDISYDDADVSGVNRRKRDAIAYFAECNFVQPDWTDNPYLLGHKLFSFEYVNGKSISRILRDRKVVKAIEKWNSFTLEEKAQCCYYFGTNPNMNESDLTYIMVGIPQTENGKIVRSEGKLLTTALWDNNVSIIDYFIEHYTADGLQQIGSLFKSAIMSKDKIIIKRGVEWLLDKKDGTTIPLGISEQECIHYLKENAPLISFIKERIGFDCPIYPDMDEKVINENKVKERNNYSIRDAAKIANIPNWASKGIKRLREELLAKGIPFEEDGKVIVSANAANPEDGARKNLPADVLLSVKEIN